MSTDMSAVIEHYRNARAALSKLNDTKWSAQADTFSLVMAREAVTGGFTEFIAGVTAIVDSWEKMEPSRNVEHEKAMVSQIVMRLIAGR